VTPPDLEALREALLGYDFGGPGDVDWTPVAEALRASGWNFTGMSLVQHVADGERRGAATERARVVRKIREDAQGWRRLAQSGPHGVAASRAAVADALTHFSYVVEQEP
jgi:hypothetical protein